MLVRRNFSSDPFQDFINDILGDSKMTTRTRKTRKKATVSTVPVKQGKVVATNKVMLTAKQAKTLVDFLAKHGKSYSWLNDKLEAVI